MKTTLVNLAGSVLLNEATRRRVFRWAGIAVDDETRIGAGVSLYTSDLRVGTRGYVGAQCYFENHSPVTLGDDVWVGPQVSFLTMTHEIGPPGMRAGPFRSERIDVGSGTWIGARSTILPGVTIGEGVVIAAGSVVREDCEANLLYAGVPATPRRDLPIAPS